MPIKDKYLIQPFYITTSILIKVLKLFQTCLIICLSISSYFNYLVVKKAAFSILARQVVFPLHNQERRDTPSFAINTHNYYSLFLIPWLNCLVFTTSIYTGYNYYRVNYTYYKASFIKVIKIVVLDAIFCLYILYQSELYSNQLRIFV